MKFFFGPHLMVILAMAALSIAAYRKTQDKVANIQTERQRYYANIDDLTKERAPIKNKKIQKRTVR